MELQTLQILTIINAGVSLIMGAYMLFLYQSSKSDGTGYWSAGSLIIGLGLLFRFIPPADGYLASVASGLFVTLGLYLYLAGIWEFKGRKIHKGLIIGVPLFDLAQSLVFFFLFHSSRIQLSVHLVVLIVYCSIALYEMFALSPGQKYLQSIFRINAFAFVVFLLLLLLNAAFVLSQTDIHPLDPSPLGLILHILSGFVMIALTFGFLMAVSTKLDHQLRSQLKSKNKFFSIIAHDLRTPVGNIMSFMELLNNESELSPQQRRNFMETLSMLSQSTFHLLQNLLEWANKSNNLYKYENTKLDLNALVDESTAIFKSSAALKSIDFEFTPGRQCHLMGNADTLLTVVRNLVSNAIKFTPKGGSVTLATQKLDQVLHLTVTDTGQGMTPETLKTLLRFDEHHSTKGTNGEVGSGLGLQLCYEFVRQHKGNLSFSSQPGQGTTATIVLPCAS
ncbi:HAMP domain-containing sensor histidine kinase [Prolixibacteraceae bacterium Z1-6]|uniref:histidine kinase n=1 Tax=Draconibacterium aestuarii TaxID=2998507 RepID=A0A9X3F4Z0_9BACT|nr:HAMP domain-containing sensor histidine kinase [Prolixibacteraceae bacterium Z1-6]